MARMTRLAKMARMAKMARLAKNGQKTPCTQAGSVCGHTSVGLAQAVLWQALVAPGKMVGKNWAKRKQKQSCALRLALSHSDAEQMVGKNRGKKGRNPAKRGQKGAKTAEHTLAGSVKGHTPVGLAQAVLWQALVALGLDAAGVGALEHVDHVCQRHALPRGLDHRHHVPGRLHCQG